MSDDPFLVHEALHMASVFCAMVDDNLVNHDAVAENPEWLQMAEQARDALMNLYQAIGQVSMRQK